VGGPGIVGCGDNTNADAYARRGKEERAEIGAGWNPTNRSRSIDMEDPFGVIRRRSFRTFILMGCRWKRLPVFCGANSKGHSTF